MDRKITLKDLNNIITGFVNNSLWAGERRTPRQCRKFIEAVLARFGASKVTAIAEKDWPLAYEMIELRGLGYVIDPATYKLEGGMAEGGVVKSADLKPGEVPAVLSPASVTEVRVDPTPEQAEELVRSFRDSHSLLDTWQDATRLHPVSSRHANDVFRHLGEELHRHRQEAGPIPKAEQAGQQFPAPGYERLHGVFRDAHDQAAYGKGNERHADDLPFHLQRMQRISQDFDSPLGMAYQVAKKLQEGLQMTDAGARRRELLGALNYLAGIVIFLDDKEAK